jgi:hypothetical protein
MACTQISTLKYDDFVIYWDLRLNFRRRRGRRRNLLGWVKKIIQCVEQLSKI